MFRVRDSLEVEDTASRTPRYQLILPRGTRGKCRGFHRTGYVHNEDAQTYFVGARGFRALAMLQWPTLLDEKANAVTLWARAEPVSGHRIELMSGIVAADVFGHVRFL